MELLFSPSMAVAAVITIITLWRVAPLITVLYARTWRWPAAWQHFESLPQVGSTGKWPWM